MNESLNQSGENETDPVFEVVQRYLQQIERGERPSRTELESQHPELVATMGPYLDAIEMLHAAAPQLRSRTSSNENASSPNTSLPIGEPLGDFQLVREIGRGGMGVVYEAVQLSLNRKVAVKVLPFAAALDSRQLQRFRNEAQAAAALHHPNIVPVYGVGCERGVHFYVMQLIDGQNLASLITNLQNDCDMFPATTMDFPQTSFANHRRATKEESKADTVHLFGAELTTERTNRREEYYRTIAEMIVQAADALDYAHSLGIVHRDVKPANILVDDNRNIWVADFGLAQIQTDHVLTRTGDMLGTLRYMSPEQAGGPSTQIDQRTDVYSLGVTLYELLTLRRLFAAENHRALFRQVLEEEPAPMRSLDRLIPKELDIIAQKALSKTPSERYASAAEMRDDLKRFLEDLPIKARSPSTLERVAKWGRRHRGIVIASVAALLVTVAGLSVAMWMTASAYDRERTKAVEAEQNFRQARAAVDEFMKIADESLVGNPMMESARIRMLESALVYYQTFIKQHRHDSFLHADLEASLAKVEVILNELKTLAGAGQYILLQSPAVREDLQLEERVIARLEAFDQRWRTMGRDMGELNRTERDHRRLELATQQRAEILQLLTAEQQARFQQLVWQEAGPRALEDKLLAKKLDLSNDQQTEIRQLFAEYNFPGKPFRFRPPNDAQGKLPAPPDHWGPQGERFFKESDEIMRKKLANILTADQSERWKQLLGKPLSEPLHR